MHDSPFSDHVFASAIYNIGGLAYIPILAFKTEIFCYGLNSGFYRFTAHPASGVPRSSLNLCAFTTNYLWNRQLKITAQETGCADSGPMLGWQGLELWIGKNRE